jgi:hypothetical protein
VTDLDLEAIKRRADAAGQVETTITRGSMSDENPLGLTQIEMTAGGARALHLSARDVPVLLAEIDRLRAELAEERQSHEQTVENFGDWIEQYNARSFKLTQPTETVGWTWRCLLCDKAHGSATYEADAFGSAVAHELRAHRTEAARAEQ